MENGHVGSNHEASTCYLPAIHGSTDDGKLWRGNMCGRLAWPIFLDSAMPCSGRVQTTDTRDWPTLLGRSKGR